ncbi:type VI secretion system-associated FHA domain protein TagH [Neptunomonas phycophila]|uniref:type VI secretion system-associated FHA domain protein TagH n=1 Tax=Neptunomonas phycophila TaxID=1572645 RepID=UPI0023F8E664|nr:type VI secretion system-associated FHA domain protein TagH [Neptunomonas phycophila]
MDLRLTVTSGQRQLLGDVYQVDVNSDIFSIGRSADNTWVLPDARLHISSKHCVIHKKNDEYHLTDISTNGVFVNDDEDPVGRGRTVILKNADMLTIGEFKIRVDLRSPFDGAASQTDIEELLTPNDTRETTPEFSEIMDQVAVQGEREIAISEIDELLAPKSNQLSSETPSVSELMAPVSPEREQFKPPEAKQPSVRPQTANREALLNDAPQADTDKEPAPSIPDNWLDLLGQPPASDRAPVEPVEKPAVSTSSPAPAKLAVDVPAPSVDEEFEGLINAASTSTSTSTSTPRKPSTEKASLSTPVESAEPPATKQAVVDAVEPAADSIIDAALALLNEKPAAAPEPDPAPVLDNEQQDAENELAALLNKEPKNVPVKSTFEEKDGSAFAARPEPEVTLAQTQFETVTHHQAPLHEPLETNKTPSTGEVGQSDLFDEFLEAAGIPVALLEGKDKSQLAQEMGAMIKNYSQGVVETLATRSLVKSEFRLQQTMIRPVDNNPLKFSPSGTEALKIMMLADSAAYMSAPRAVDEGFKDIQAHQLAMMSGIQAAFAHLLERFNPEDLQRKFDRRPRHQKGILGRQRVDYWLEYVDFYDDICAMMEDQFQDLFSAEFGKAYEDQLRSLDK